MVIYFSGTGNSRYCAETIAKHLNDEIVDSKEYIKNGKFTYKTPCKVIDIIVLILIILWFPVRNILSV